MQWSSIDAPGRRANALAWQHVVAFVDNNIGEVLSDQGHFDEASTHLVRAGRVSSATRDLQNIALADMLLGRLEVRRGNYREGLPMLATGRGRAEPVRHRVLRGVGAGPNRRGRGVRR